MAPIRLDNPAKCKPNINKSKLLSAKDNGAYIVQPEPQPFSISKQIKILIKEKGINQKLKLFNLGNTMSGADS
jgi:hypothetical protein